MYKMAEKFYNQNELGLKVTNSSLTGAISNLEESCKLLDKSPDSFSTATKLRLSGSILKALELVSEKEKKVSVYREKLVESLVEFDAEEFKKVSTTQKDELLTSMEKYFENYETKAKLCIEANDGVIKKAETLLSNTQALQAVKTQSSTASV